jgi:hypothetical protein
MTMPITRAGRLLLLYRLQEAGLLRGQTSQVIADHLGVDRSTIIRDLQVLDLVEEEYERLMAERPWLEPSPTEVLRDAGYVEAKELAATSGYRPDYLSRLMREGKVEAKKVYGRWWIHPKSIQAYIEDKEAGRGPPRGPHGPRD